VNLAGSMATFLLATWEEQQVRDTPVWGADHASRRIEAHTDLLLHIPKAR